MNRHSSPYPLQLERDLERLNLEEKDELERETAKVQATTEKVTLLIHQLDELFLSQSISPVNRGSYFDYRPNYPLQNVRIPYFVTKQLKWL